MKATNASIRIYVRMAPTLKTTTNVRNAGLTVPPVLTSETNASLVRTPLKLGKSINVSEPAQTDTSEEVSFAVLPPAQPVTCTSSAQPALLNITLISTKNVYLAIRTVRAARIVPNSA